MIWFKRFFDGHLIKRSIRFWWQRQTRGWDDSQTWSMDSSLAKLILPRLKRFQEVRAGYPSNMTDEEWGEIIQEMIWGFQWFADGKQYSYDYVKEADQANRANNAIDLFARYYSTLWW